MYVILRIQFPVLESTLQPFHKDEPLYVAYRNNIFFLISNFPRIVNAVFFIFGDFPASDIYVSTFCGRNSLFLNAKAAGTYTTV
jgi:hypothetical protein